MIGLLMNVRNIMDVYMPRIQFYGEFKNTEIPSDSKNVVQLFFYSSKKKKQISLAYIHIKVVIKNANFECSTRKKIMFGKYYKNHCIKF